jgi:phosphatidylglycerophosphate synthase
MPLADKPRPRSELVMFLVRPAANAVVRALARTSVEPWQVVAGHTVIGFVAAYLVATYSHSEWVWAAVLLQVKTVLDNADGGLARATGRVTEFGRYFDTVCDLLVNVALFAALTRHGPAAGAWVAFVIVTLALTADFNAERLYKEARGVKPSEPGPPGAWAWSLALVRGFYQAVLSPQDRAYRALDAWLFRTAAGKRWTEADSGERQRWADLFSTGALVNLGLSTQYLALGIVLALGMPYAYVMICWAQLAYVTTVQAVRVLRYRARAATA